MGLLLRECFTVSREAFYQDLRPKYILPRLIVDEIITYEEQNMILEKDNTKVQVHELMRILYEKNDPKVFESFVTALKEDDAYFWLADILVEKKKKLGYNDNNFNLPYHLAAGGVPLQTDYLLERTDLLEKVRINLKEAAGKRQWIVLHGMIGCGKSVIAAEAIRNENLFQECFKDGVCWIPIGSLKNETAVFLKLQCLWEKLNPNQIFPWTNQEVMPSRREELKKVTKALRTAFTKLNQNFLLILDDVWDKNVIQAFDIGCTTLVTTTNKGVVDSFKGLCSYVPFSDGLSLDEAKRFLSLYVDVVPSDLPIEVEAIHHKCKGLPLLLCLIGGNMSEYGNQIDRWKYWTKEFEKGITGALERKRHFSGELSYLIKTLKLIFDMLPEDIKDYYLDFAIFEEDVYIPNKVLELLWDLDRFAVEDIMMELYKRSLVCLDNERNCYMYSIHDVYLKFLKDECENDRLVNCHKKLINAYLKICKKDETYDYNLLPNDGYIYNYIGYHLAAAHEEALFPKIFFDLKFLENKVRFSAPGDVLYDFETYRNCFDNDYKEKEDMVAFIRRNAHVICRADSDIIQLALFEPSNKTVYKKAKESVSLKPLNGKIYYEWCNQENVPYRSLLNVNMNFEDLTCVTFSPNNNVVVAVGSSEKIQVWESASGKVLETLSGHTDSINCCTFNLTGTLLATASADKTVKLWQINHTNYVSGKRSSKSYISMPLMDMHIENVEQSDTSLLTYKSHELDVLWCSFSSDDNRAVSSDLAGAVHVWEPETGKSLWKFFHSNEQSSHNVIRCYFAPSSQYVATAANEVIKLWNYSTKTCAKNCFTHKSHVADFCFSENSKYIYSVSGFTVGRWSSDNRYQEVFSSNENSLYYCCCLSPNEQFIAVGTSECFIIVWNVITKKIIANLKGHKNPVVKVEFSRDGSKLLSASNDGHVTIWDISDCKATSMVSLENNLSVRQVAELTIASSDQLNRIQVRVKTDGNLKFKSSSDDNDITACSMSYDCSEVVYGTKSGSVKIFNLSNEKTEFCFSHEKKVTYLIHIKNSQFVSCSEDATLKIWSDKIALVGHSDSVVMCVPYDDGKHILSCSEDGTMIAWNLESALGIMVLAGHGNQKVNFCDVSADGKFFCSASSDCTIKIWNAEHGQLMHILKCNDCVRCCRFSPTEKTLLSGEDSGHVLVWEYGDSWIQNWSLEYVDGWVKDIKFSEDGSQVLVVGESIKLWTWSSGTWTHAQTFILPGAFSCSVWASPDFKILVFVHNSILYILKTVL